MYGTLKGLERNQSKFMDVQAKYTYCWKNKLVSHSYQVSYLLRNFRFSQGTLISNSFSEDVLFF